MQYPLVRSAVGAAIAVLCNFAAAQGTLKEVTVTGNPLGASDVVAPAIQLSGPTLLLRSQSTLGETLNGLPGVSSTYFGPAASRPVIRGLDGDRIRILNNSGAALDVSNLSYDHAVAADPIAVERIEILRGPGALLYGGNAIGGVVNLIDNRIPREPSPGFSGKADAGWSSGSRERSGALMLEGGTERFGVHVDGFRRSYGETRVPLSLSCTQNGATRSGERICNSQGETDGGAVGGSVFLDKGYIGASASTFGSVYGAVAEDEVTIRMRNERFALEGEMRELGGWFSSVKGRLGYGRYLHTEFDAGVAGTVFRNHGGDLRLEGRHRAIGGLQGVIGVQADHNRFSAEGSEAFAPPSRTRQAALFAYEELPAAWGKLTFGARAEQVTVASLGSASTPRFLAAERKFHPGSAAIGALWNATPAWQVTGNLAHSQRAPKDYELFADGPHVATGAYEVGNPNLGKERSTHAEVGLQWKRDANLFRLNAYQSRFSNYVALLGTGVTRDADGNGAGTGVTDCGDGTSAESGCTAESFSEFAYTPVRARFEGLEANGIWRLLAGARTLDVEWRADVVRARNLTIGQPLPRISPARAGATLVGNSGPWSARIGFDHHARQDRVPVGDTPTAGFTLWHAALSYRMKAGAANLLWFARLDNASDRQAYSATSILTQSAPGRVPLPGRSMKVGVQATF